MSAIFSFEKGATKKNKFLKGCYFVMGSPIDMNIDMFRDFLKGVVLQLFPKYNQSNINVNVKSRSKFNCL